MTKIIKRNKFLIVLALIAAVVISTIFVGQASPMFAHASTGENQAIEKVYTNLTLEQDFSDETILVVLNKTATFSFKTYTAEDFSEIGNVYVEEITAGSSQIVRQQRETNVSRQGHSVKVSDDYRRILKLTLQDKGKENIIDAVRKLERRDDVVSAEPSFAGSATATTPTEYPNLTAHPDLTKNNRLTNLHTQRWWIDQIDLPNAWDYEHNATGVTVAVVDTGIDSTHPDLEHRISAIPSVDYIGTDALADPNGHGTHVASTIGGEANNGGMAGVAWNVRFVSIRVFNAAGSGTANYAAQITESVEYAATNGIQIVSHSGGGNTGTTNTFNALLTQLQNYNGLFICAAGNNNVNNNNNSWFPGNVRAANVITVGATDTDDTRSWFSSWGTPTVANPDSRVDVFAPGSMIFAGYSQDRCTNATVNPTTGLRSCESWVNENFHHEDGYHFLSGTSMATPIVSGTAALLFSIYGGRNHGLTAAQVAAEIRTIIIDTVDPIAGLNNLCIAGGRLNAYEAVKRAAYHTTPLSSNNVKIDGLANGLKTSITGSLTIPDTIRFRESGNIVNRTVTEIGSSAFANSMCTGITIPSSVTNIGASAFSYCYNLTEFTIPANVIDIGARAFSWCPLSGITLASGNTAFRIEGNCLIRVSDNTVICGFDTSVLPSSVTAIGDYAFEGCSGLTTMLISNNVTAVGASAFSGCANITIYAEAGSRPGGWSSNWNLIRPVFWGCTLSSDSNGAYVKYFNKNSNNSISNPSAPNGIQAPYRAGYNFYGWANIDDATNVYTTSTIGGAPYGTYQAVWLNPALLNNPYTVTFYKDGGNYGSSSVTAYYGSTMPSANPPEKIGYKFEGYYYQINGVEIQYYDDDMQSARPYDIEGNATLYAKWTINTYTVTFKDYDGTVLKTQTGVEHGSAATAPSTPDNKQGWHFTNWDVSFSAVTSNLTVTAVYAINTYTISYNPGANGTGTVSDTYKTHGTPGTLSSGTFMRNGYAQTGWSTTDGGAKAYNLGDSNYTPEGNATLYPFWTVANTYTLTFDQQGGYDGTDSVTATPGLAMPYADAPEHEWLTFEGYYSKPNGGGIQYYDANMQSLNSCGGEKVLYAKWSEDVVLEGSRWIYLWKTSGEINWYVYSDDTAVVYGGIFQAGIGGSYTWWFYGFTFTDFDVLYVSDEYCDIDVIDDFMLYIGFTYSGTEFRIKLTGDVVVDTVVEVVEVGGGCPVYGSGYTYTLFSDGTMFIEIAFNESYDLFNNLFFVGYEVILGSDSGLYYDSITGTLSVVGGAWCTIKLTGVTSYNPNAPAP